MKLKNTIYLLAVVFALSSCNSNAQGVKQLNAEAFDKGIRETNIQLVDVRTTEEYNEKHIANSIHINIDGKDFEEKMAALDKSKATYIYCLAGSRSNKAGGWAVKNGFKEVYNLEKGITEWIGAKKPVETKSGEAPSAGMTFEEYLKSIKGEKLVLVDFTAVWCGPCKMLKPALHKVSKDYSDKVTLLEIDVDKNPVVSSTMNIASIPLLILYRDGKELWRNLGLTDEKTIADKIKHFSK